MIWEGVNRKWFSDVVFCKIFKVIVLILLFIPLAKTPAHILCMLAIKKKTREHRGQSLPTIGLERLYICVLERLVGLLVGWLQRWADSIVTMAFEDAQFTKTKVSPKLKCHQTKSSLKLKCHQKLIITKDEMSRKPNHHKR